MRLFNNLLKLKLKHENYMLFIVITFYAENVDNVLVTSMFLKVKQNSINIYTLLIFI